MTIFEAIKEFVKDADIRDLAHYLVYLKHICPYCPKARTLQECPYKEHTCEDCFEEALRQEAKTEES